MKLQAALYIISFAAYAIAIPVPQSGEPATMPAGEAVPPMTAVPAVRGEANTTAAEGAVPEASAPIESAPQGPAVGSDGAAAVAKAGSAIGSKVGEVGFSSFGISLLNTYL